MKLTEFFKHEIKKNTQEYGEYSVPYKKQSEIITHEVMREIGFPVEQFEIIQALVYLQMIKDYQPE